MTEHGILCPDLQSDSIVHGCILGSRIHMLLKCFFSFSTTPVPYNPCTRGGSYDGECTDEILMMKLPNAVTTRKSHWSLESDICSHTTKLSVPVKYDQALQASLPMQICYSLLCYSEPVFKVP